MRHHVDLPNLAPAFVRDLFETGHSTDARVRAEEINGAESLIGFCDQGDNVDFARDIGFDSYAVDLGGDLRGRFEINVCDYDGARAFGREASAQRAAYAVRAAGDDHNFVLQFHCALPDDVKSERSLAEAMRISEGRSNTDDADATDSH